MKVRENMGPLSPYISLTIGNFEMLPDAKSHENCELSNDKKISAPFIFDILHCSFSTLSQTIFWPNIPMKDYSMPRYPSLANTAPF